MTVQGLISRTGLESFTIVVEYKLDIFAMKSSVGLLLLVHSACEGAGLSYCEYNLHSMEVGR